MMPYFIKKKKKKTTKKEIHVFLLIAMISKYYQFHTTEKRNLQTAHRCLSLTKQRHSNIVF